MALPEPSWKIKTNPCPFYQQGKCMFAESCNFLHNVSVTAIPEAGPGTLQNLPNVVVESPNSIRSPPRSPRTTSLLLALRDVIGDPENDIPSAEPVYENSPHSEGENWSESLPTLVNEFGFGHHSQPEGNIQQEPYLDEDDENDSSGHWTAISDYDDEDQTSRPIMPMETTRKESDGGLVEYNDPNLGHEANSTSLVLGNDASSIEPTVSFPGDRNSVASTSGSGLLSPIELSNLHLGPFRQRLNRSTNSFDSGYADNWKPPIPMLTSPPRSPSISSTFDLLSSPFGSHTARVFSPYLGPFMRPSPVSPARTISPHMADDVEPLDLSLDSPNHDSRNQLTAPVTFPALSAEEPSESFLHSDELQQQLDEGLSESDDEEILEQPYGHTSLWDSEGAETAVFMGNNALIPIDEQVGDAIDRLGKTPTHFLASKDLQFNDSEVEGSSFACPKDISTLSTDTNGDVIAESQQPSSQASENILDEDDTSLLAYTHSPLNTSQENDTLTSLYDIYSDTTLERDSVSNPRPGAQLLRGANSSLSNPSTPSSSLRERVFTPPPVARKRSGTITADSPNSLSSPMTSLDSVSMGRSSPFSPLGDSSARSHSPYGQDIELSRKVPFGFRSSFSLGGTSRSSLITNRIGGRSVPPSPLQTHVEDSIPEPQHSDSDSSFSAPGSKGLKPLRLSTIVDANISRSTFHSGISTSTTKPINSFRPSGIHHHASIPSANVSSNNSLSHSRLLASTRSSLLPSQIRNSLLSSVPSPLSNNFANLEEPQSAPVDSWRNSVTYSRSSSRLSGSFYENNEDDPDTICYTRDPFDEAIRRPIPTAPHTAPVTRAPSTIPPSLFAIDTPRPTLMFAIASDDVTQVRQVLERGDAGPNDAVGPQSALAFTLTNDKLANKLEIVKTLLAYGADPKVAKTIQVPAQSPLDEDDSQQLPSQELRTTRTLMDMMDPATKYYLERADAVHTRRISVLIQRSFFRPLTRVRYELIGQDRALEQLFRVLSMHSRDLAASPMVVMLCGPSGHGKSLLARKFGSLLDVPTHTVNMTTLRSTHDLWQSYSMSPYETPTTCTLAEFLINNEGKRCVVVLDEIEKTEDPKTLWSLLMPWELGRCAFEAGARHIDVKNVIWLGTSNIGHDLVFQHRDSRKNSEEPMSREEYVELMALLRPKVSERLGASVLSRITTVLPFVPFTLEEKKAICSEALYTLGGGFLEESSPETIEGVINTALSSYCAIEGARSLHRAISNQLVDIM